MKKIFLLIMMLLPACLVAEAANYSYVPIVREGVQWVYRLDYYNADTGKPCETTMTIYFEGDTVIDGLTFKKCYRTYGTNDRGKCKNDQLYGGLVYNLTTEPVLIACCLNITGNFNDHYMMVAIYSTQFKQEMRNYNTCVMEEEYYKLDDPNQAYYVYALNSKSWVINSSNPFSDFYTSSSVRMTKRQFDNEFNFKKAYEISINGDKRVCISNYEMDGNIYNSTYTAWIEGIGFFGYDFNTATRYYNRGGNIVSPAATYRFFDAFTDFNHVVEDGKIVYKSPRYQDLSQLQSGIGDVKVPQIETADNNYYNLMGQPVAHPEDAPGIYIHEGKKVVVK